MIGHHTVVLLITHEERAIFFPHESKKFYPEMHWTLPCISFFGDEGEVPLVATEIAAERLNLACSVRDLDCIYETTDHVGGKVFLFKNKSSLYLGSLFENPSSEDEYLVELINLLLNESYGLDPFQRNLLNESRSDDVMSLIGDESELSAYGYSYDPSAACSIEGIGSLYDLTDVVTRKPYVVSSKRKTFSIETSEKIPEFLKPQVP